MTRRRLRAPAKAALCAAALAASLAGCALGPYSPGGVPAGASRDEVLRVMGPPTATYTMPDGHERLEYNRMPAGKQTFMVDLDAGGHMAHWENVLDENHFAAIAAGMRREDVLRLIGPPTFTARYARPAPGITWLYRFETIQRCILFEVSFDVATGKVLDGDYPPDPGCADNTGR
jgi:outer membrane protein assembly factor BamE (lipoprotein component of BamABCDE complex)